MIGVWGLFFQNAGYFTSKNKRDLDEIIGRIIKVQVVNMVDANIQAINGHRDVFFNNPSKGQKKNIMYYLFHNRITKLKHKQLTFIKYASLK